MKISDLKLTLKFANMTNDTVLIEGVHGVGKSSVVLQFSKEFNLGFIDLRLANNEVGDLIGNTEIHEDENGNKTTIWTKPSWLHRMEEWARQGIRTVLFLDEMNRAPLDVRQCAMQLVLDKRIHEHELPKVDGQYPFIVSAINPSDEYQVDEMDPALLDRFLSVTLDVDAPEWIRYSREQQWNKIVRDFITENQDRLHHTPKDGGVGSSPRSWERVGYYIDIKNEIPPEVLYQIVMGRVGQTVGAQFITFMNNYTTMVKSDDIEELVEREKDNVKNIDEMAELISELIAKCEKATLFELAETLCQKWMPQNDILPYHAYLYALPPEVQVAVVRGLRDNDSTSKYYPKLAKIDDKVNNKELFKRIVNASKG